MNPLSQELSSILQNLPDKPGVYQFFGEGDTLIYVGKAKSLKKRVSSYFNRGQYDSGKTAVMVKRIENIRYIVVETELDALLLENNLIKKYQPRYNVLLKDDKTFPWICIKNERFPRVFKTRKLIRDGSQYFGPFVSVRMIDVLLELIAKLYRLRNCNLALSEENISKKKFKVCLEYQIGNCKGPCENLQSEEDYRENISQIRDIFKGNAQQVISRLKEEMRSAAGKYEFEKAQQVKEKLELLENFRSKSIVVNPSVDNTDVFSIISEGDYAFVNFLKVVNGAIIQSHTVEMKKKLDESLPELLVLAVTELRARFQSDSKEILVSIDPEIELPGIHFTIPKIGDKKHLLDLSEKNIRYYLRDRALRLEKMQPKNRSERLLAQAMKDLRLKELPVHIECFDNSNIQGNYPVAALAVFKNGKPSKKDYRHFNIRTVEGPDDFASMEEVISRRYKRLLEEKQPLPQLIIVDGGKGQLSSAVKTLDKLGLRGKTGIIGIAKRLEEIYYPGDSLPMYLNKKSETLKLIQHLRDEAHRFGITHHRSRRTKGTVKTELSSIAGIGPATAEKLLNHFKSVKRIRNAKPEEIEKVIGKSKRKILLDYFSDRS